MGAFPNAARIKRIEVSNRCQLQAAALFFDIRSRSSHPLSETDRVAIESLGASLEAMRAWRAGDAQAQRSDLAMVLVEGQRRNRAIPCWK
jgi:hypothetical protein